MALMDTIKAKAREDKKELSCRRAARKERSKPRS